MFDAENYTTTKLIWLGVGLAGQLCFFMRFFWQWLASERAGRSIIPDVFWYFSIGGAIILLSYAIHQQDLVFILGQSFGVFVYTRNLYLIARERKAGGLSSDA